MYVLKVAWLVNVQATANPFCLFSRDALLEDEVLHGSANVIPELELEQPY